VSHVPLPPLAASPVRREIEIWFTEHGGRFYLVAVRESANWVRDIQSQPQVKVRVGDAELHAIARAVQMTASLGSRHCEGAL
jgi:hypothetical protein